VKVVALARASPVAYVELRVNSRHVMNFRASASTIRWSGAAKLAAGLQRITLIARAVDGASSTVSVVVRHR